MVPHPNKGHRGVITWDLDCWLWLNFIVDTAHRLCLYTAESSKTSFDRLIGLVKYYPMPPAQSNDCAGRITAAKIVKATPLFIFS